MIGKDFGLSGFSAAINFHRNRGTPCLGPLDTRINHYERLLGGVF